MTSQIGDEFEDLCGSDFVGRPEACKSMPDASSELGKLIGGCCLHRTLELRRMSLEGVQLGIDEVGHIFIVIGLIGFKQEQRRWAMRGEVMLAKEMGIARCHQSFAREQTGVTVIWVQAVSLPRIVSENDVGLNHSDAASNFTSQCERTVEFAVDLVEKHHVAALIAREPQRSLALFQLASGHKGHGVGIWIPAPLRTIGEDEVMNYATHRCPLGQGGTTAELDVVGVSADGQG